MATIPAPPTFTVGQKLTAALMNTNVRDAINFLLAPPLCVITRSTAQTVTTGATALIAFDTEAVDSDSMFNVGTSATNLVAVTPGWYSVTAAFTWGANVAGSRLGAFLLNGVTVIAPNEQQANTVTGHAISIAISTELFLNIGDTLAVEAIQTSGASLAMNAGARFSAQWTHS